LIIENGSHHQLLLVRAMIFRVAVSPETVPALSRKVEGRGIKEDQIKPGEQVVPLAKDTFFDEVLGAARGKGCPTLLLLISQLFSEPSHCSIQGMQL
jgi:hypothetical protein